MLYGDVGLVRLHIRKEEIKVVGGGLVEYLYTNYTGACCTIGCDKLYN